MADLPFLVELNEQNLTETLQRSIETPLVINFYAPSHKESADFANVLQRVAEQHQGQFILGLVNCETEQMIAAQFRIHNGRQTIALLANGKHIHTQKLS